MSKEICSYIVVDSNKDTGALIGHKLKAFPHCEMIASFETGVDALAFLMQNECDLIFLEVELPYMDGFLLLDILAKERQLRPTVMMTSTPMKYSEKAHLYYGKGLIDFISKSAEADRYAVSIERFEQKAVRIPISKQKMVSSRDSITVITSSKEVKKIRIKDILYFSYIKNYTNIYTIDGKKYCENISLKNMQSALPKDCCIQVNRYSLVMVHQIVKYDQASVVLRKNELGEEIKLPIFSTKRKEVLDKLTRITT